MDLQASSKLTKVTTRKVAETETDRSQAIGPEIAWAIRTVSGIGGAESRVWPFTTWARDAQKPSRGLVDLQASLSAIKHTTLL